LHRDPNDVEDRFRFSARAMGLVLGAWITFFLVLGIVVVPLLFGLCEVR
jgi:hypothetical protein